MGYLIQNTGELVKIEKFLREAELQSMATAPTIVVSSVPGLSFCIVNAFLQIYAGGTIYSGYNHIQLTDSATLVYASFGYSVMQVGFVNSFICSLKHPVNEFGATFQGNRDIYIESDLDPTSGSGDGLLTMYGYWINTI